MNETKSHFARNLIVTGLIAAGLATAGYFYVKHQEEYPSTDDAYVHANIVYVAPQVSGKVISSNVADYQTVSKGDLLVQIDPAPYQAQLDEAKAAYELATQNNAATDDAILAASANVKTAMAQLSDAQSTYRRIKDLVNKKLYPQQELDDAKAKLSTAENNVEAARANMSQLIKSQGAKGKDAPEVKKAAAALSQASLSLSYTNIFADHDGKLGKVSVHPGSVVAPGQALMPLVEANTYWVQANFKEDQVGRMHIGMPATIELDLYPNIDFHGTIAAISPASGSSFSLLPPENATGNWVKVPQRFPVLIELNNEQENKAHPLRVGASATVTVDTLAKTDDAQVAQQGK
ncbi:HlyD family secretion protein [Photobacterium damselae]|uniref:HlyD family secretion protein n=1 Tax=Photobacterium damselae TaxID=38293 RepID=UPI0012484416|nr:HlyD family secretion protein [Photobacterium damselae]KAB1178526.1 HlyD family secretion protein [Photobacterium damselae subsp. damselae]MBF7099445.1 HlyD family secretion protein [Photobacterium damselae]